MNWKKWSVVGMIALFVVVNFFLIFKKDSEVARSKYINDWRTVKEQNLVLTKQKEGVVTPAEEENVYFQNGMGDFGEFLVTEGEEIHSGTPLFEYSPKNVEATIKKLEAEVTKLKNDRDAIKENISRLEKIRSDLSKKKEKEEDTSNKDAIDSTIKAQIYEKESQLSRVEGEIERLEELVSISEDDLDGLKVSSTISGVVKKISHDLQNPVMTITSSKQQIKGLLDEEEILEVEEGMKVIISSKTLKNKLEGVIAKIAVNPEQEPQVHVNSQYEFVVEFAEVGDDAFADKNDATEAEETKEDKSDQNRNVTDEDEEAVETEDIPSKVFNGAHVDLKIVIKEVEDARTLPADTIRNGYIYALKQNGKIEKRKIKTGIMVNGIYEITENVEKGELVLNNPSNIKNKTAFFTPIEVSKVKKKDLQGMRKKEILKYLGQGLLSNQ
ncbi:hypothetical protein [Robertmurraya andreesenii]|uniref:HlyD family secretion protein n=1 Tax=Anoxybacillus andreesenii TaxID=1325932 RepID=A0ABT9UZZ6_9BACL|nr:hypothetical protein [Robertmurraya andreesenii]MDQ0154265.1 HlyD family secretion protein [Robertmurraya andreesenii]